MNRREAKEIIKSRFADYLKPARNVGGKPSYVCPLCDNGTGHDGDGIVLDPKREGYKLHCFKCGFDGDLIDLVQQERHCQPGEAFEALYSLFGIVVDDYEPRRADVKPATVSSGTETRPESQEMPRGETETATADYSAYYSKCYADLGDPRAQDYLSLRGISDGTARRFALGFDKSTGYLVMPATAGYYTARNIDPEARQRYNNPKGAKVEPFNLQALYTGERKPVFVVEGAIDALSIEEAGGRAVALNSASNTRLLLEAIEARPTSKRLILALDNDEAGARAAKAIRGGLDALGVRHTTANPYGEHHDANDALRADRQQLAASIAQAERAAGKPDNMADYMLNTLYDEATALQAQAHRNTGFANLDEQAGAIYSGLYAIGGISSVGKTSFISQLADQMAASGQHVLFFSLEQSRLELASKSIARRTAQKDPRAARTALQIRLGDWTTDVVEAFNGYIADTGERVSVIEGNFSCTVGYIRRYAADYMEANGGVKCVVIVDYLQVLQADVDPATGRRISDKRLAVDYNVTELKRMSRELDIPVFVVSSFNRAGYLAAIDFESFKESGGIEYTSDVVWGLQLAAIHDELFKSDEGKDRAKKRERIAEAKEAIPRDVELVCLKNRYGKSRYSCRFTYYPQFDLFEPQG